MGGLLEKQLKSQQILAETKLLPQHQNMKTILMLRCNAGGNKLISIFYKVNEFLSKEVA